MKCPIDDSTLSVSSREGVEIDFCPQCRGVWLDRGELDKIIDRVTSTLATAPAAPAASNDRDRGYDDRYDDRGRGYDERRPDDRGYRRRRSATSSRTSLTSINVWARA